MVYHSQLSKMLALWKTASGDAVLECSIENCCIKNSEDPVTQHENLSTIQVVSLCSPQSTLCRRYITISIRTIFYLNSLNIQICVSQRSRNQMALCVLRHTIMMSPTCALTPLFVPDNHWQGCPWRHLKSNTCVRRILKHTNFNLFLARLIK